MPAILKGWLDRVFVHGFAFGVTDPESGRVRKYGDGGLVGRRALAVVAAGDRPGALSDRGVSGSIDDLMFPLTHGVFHYTGMLPMRTHLVASSHHLDAAAVEEESRLLRERVAGLTAEEPLRFRHLASDDYDEDYRLRDGVAPGRTDLSAHVRP